MKNLLRIVCQLMLLIVAFSIALRIVSCTDAQKSAVATQAQNTHDALTPGTPTTQPGVQAVQGVVGVIEQVLPVSTAIISAIAGLAGLVAGAAGGAKVGSTVATTQAESAITEIIDDIAAYKQPGVKWTVATEKLLVDVVGAASPAVTTP